MKAINPATDELIKDYEEHTDADPPGGFDLLGVHHKAAVPHYGHHLFIRPGELCRDSPGQRYPHAGETVRYQNRK